MPITEFLARNAAEYKDDVAIVEINPSLDTGRRYTWKDYALIEPAAKEAYRKEMTWGEFDKKANRFANLLLTRGIRRGDKVAILLMNGIEWLPIYFGILKTGAIAVPLNFRYSSEEIKYCLELSDSDMLVFGPEFVGRIEEIYTSLKNIKYMFYVGDDCPSFAESYFKLVSYCSSHAPHIELCDDDFGAIYFSSGTTGFPKAILHKHRSLMHACIVEQKHHMQTKEDVFLCIPPLYHTGAKMHWFGSLLTAGKAVLLKGTSPEYILRSVSEEKCSIVWLLVPWVQDILDAIDRKEINLDDYDLSQWRLMHIGAQPVPPSLIKRWMKLFPHHLYDTNYGLSESIGPGCVHLGVENIEKIGSIGKAGYGWQTKIVNDKCEIVKRGEIGELAVKGPGVMSEYYKDEKATAAVLKDGWLLTGDMAREDEDGFIYLVDRKKDVIITGGENLYPVEIENFIRRHDAVKDVAVIGLPDKRLGEIAAAIIEVKPGMSVSEQDINDFCSAMPRYKRPRKIFFDDIPRNPTGKIEKPRLRKKYCSDHLVASQNEIGNI